MNIVLPPATTPLSVILDTLRRALIPAVSQNEAVARILLRSPNGTIYEVTVADDGTLNTEVNDGKTRT